MPLLGGRNTVAPRQVADLFQLQSPVGVPSRRFLQLASVAHLFAAGEGAITLMWLAMD